MLHQYRRMLVRYYQKCDNIEALKNAEKTLLRNGFSIQEICNVGVNVNYDRAVIYSDKRNF